MAAYDYGKARTKAFRNLADHCHDKAVDAISPHTAAAWIALMDTLMWCAGGDGDTDAILTHAKPPVQS